MDVENEALDLAVAMAKAGCNEDDITKAVDSLIEILAGIKHEALVKCRNGTTVSITRINGAVEVAVFSDA